MASETANPLIDPQPPAPLGTKESSNRRLWIEFATTAVAWHLLNFLNCVIAWRACVHQEPLGGPNPNPGARILFFLLWIAVFSVAAWSGVLSYRTWRKLSGASGLLSAEARERPEYMSLCGLFITVTLGCGFLWLCIPLFIVQMCLRTR